MKNNLKAITILLFAMVMLSGCIKVNTTVDIKSDGKADLGVIFAYNKAMAESDNENGTTTTVGDMSQSIEKLNEQGIEAEEYNDGNFVGLKIIKNDIELDNLNEEYTKMMESLGTNQASQSTTDLIDVQKDKDEYTIVIKNNTQMSELENQAGSLGGNTEDSSNDIEGNSGEQGNEWDNMVDQDSNSKQMMNMMKASGAEVKFTVTLPTKCIESNATEVSEDGKTLSWDLLSDNLDEIRLTFKLGNGILGIIIKVIVVIIGIVLIAAIIIGVTKILKRKPKNDTDINTDVNINAETRCEWCNELEEKTLRIKYYIINKNNKVYSYNKETKEIISGIAEYCPCCGRRINSVM